MRRDQYNIQRSPTKGVYNEKWLRYSSGKPSLRCDAMSRQQSVKIIFIFINCNYNIYLTAPFDRNLHPISRFYYAAFLSF